MNLLNTIMRIISFMAIYFFLLTENSLTPYGIFLASIIGFTIALATIPSIATTKQKEPEFLLV